MKRNLYVFLLGALFVLTGCERDEAFETPPSNLRSITYFRLQPYHNEGKIPTTFNGSINETDKTITLKVPSTLDLTALRPEVLITPWATVYPLSLEPVDFSGPEPVEYTVTAESGKFSVYEIIIDPTHQFAGVVQYGVWVNNVIDPSTGMPCRTTFNSQAGRVWNLRVPEETDISALELEFEPDNTSYNCRIGVSSIGEEGPFEPFINGGTVDFSQNPEECLWFRFTAENGNTTTVYQLTIAYFS